MRLFALRFKGLGNSGADFTDVKIGNAAVALDYLIHNIPLFYYDFC